MTQSIQAAEQTSNLSGSLDQKTLKRAEVMERDLQLEQP